MHMHGVPQTEEQKAQGIADRDTVAVIARRCLLAYGLLQAADVLEPASGDDGNPYDPHAWMRWRAEWSKPYREQWSLYAKALELKLGAAFPGRHPYNLLPWLIEHYGFLDVELS